MSDILSAKAVAHADPAIRRLSFADLHESLRQGVDDFRAIPTQLVFLGLMYPVIGLAGARAAVNELLPLVFPLLAGISLMGPVMAVGLYEISRRREAGLPVNWTTAFEVLKSPAIGSIILMALVLLAIFVTWLITAKAIYAATMGIVAPTAVGDFVHLVIHTDAGHRLTLVGNLVGACFAVVVMVISVVSLPMLLDRNCSPVLAVRTSVRAVVQNPIVMAGWGLIVAVLLFVGSLPVLVGLAVVMPILGHSTWHLYRHTVV